MHILGEYESIFVKREAPTTREGACIIACVMKGVKYVSNYFIFL